MGWISDGVRWGLYGGIYLVIGLVLTMGRRVNLSFTEGGVGYQVSLKNWRWLDLSAIVIFLLFFFVEILLSGSALSDHAALVLFVLHAVRLAGWHTPGIWKCPLLWSLFAAYAFLVSGFLLHAFSRYFGSNLSLP